MKCDLNRLRHVYLQDSRHLKHLFGAYFHLDWKEEYENEEDAIRSFVFDDGSEDAYRTIKELDEFLALELSEPELRKAIVNDFGSGYYRGYTLKTAKEVCDWLRWVRDTLAKYAAEKTEQEKSEPEKLRQK